MKIILLLILISTKHIFGTKILQRKLVKNLQVPQNGLLKDLDANALFKVIFSDKEREDAEKFEEKFTNILKNFSTKFDEFHKEFKELLGEDSEFEKKILHFQAVMLLSPENDLKKGIKDVHIDNLTIDDYYDLDSIFVDNLKKGFDIFFIHEMIEKLPLDKIELSLDAFNGYMYLLRFIFIDSKENLIVYKKLIDLSWEKSLEFSVAVEDEKEQKILDEKKRFAIGMISILPSKEDKIDIFQRNGIGKEFTEKYYALLKSFRVLTSIINNHKTSEKVEPFRDSIAKLVRGITSQVNGVKSESRDSFECSAILSNTEAYPESVDANKPHPFTTLISAAHCFSEYKQSKNTDVVTIFVNNAKGDAVEFEIKITVKDVKDKIKKYLDSPIPANDYINLELKDYNVEPVIIEVSSPFIIQRLTNKEEIEEATKVENGFIMSAGYPGMDSNSLQPFPGYFSTLPEFKSQNRPFFINELFPQSRLYDYFLKTPENPFTCPVEKEDDLLKELEDRKFGGHNYQGMSGGAVFLLFPNLKKKGQFTISFIGINSQGVQGIQTYCPFQETFLWSGGDWRILI